MSKLRTTFSNAETKMWAFLTFILLHRDRFRDFHRADYHSRFFFIYFLLP